MSLEDIIATEIKEFKESKKYKIMLEAEDYYLNRSDVQNKQNEVSQRSNTKIEYPILKKLIDQKINYLLTRDFSIDTEKEEYSDALNEVFDASFRKKLKSFVRGAIKSGICWMQPYFDGTLKFMRISATEVIPFWKDTEHTQLDCFIRFYEQEIYIGKDKKIVIKAEFWDLEGVKYYVSTDEKGDSFLPDNDKGIESNHIIITSKSGVTQEFNWEEIPILWIKYNEEELPLFYFLKELIDNYNWQASSPSDILKDITKFVWVLKNYGGEDLGEFVENLKKFLAIKVEENGGVDKLEPTLNIDASMQMIEKMRADIYDYGNGVDTKDENLGNSSGVAILFRYTDLDNEGSNLSNELKECFQRLKIFLDFYFQATGKGKFLEDDFDITFNADMPVNETDVINNVRTSDGVVSTRTLLENHPWVTDIEKELEEIDEEKKKALEEYGEGLFSPQLQNGQGMNDGQKS